MRKMMKTFKLFNWIILLTVLFCLSFKISAQQLCKQSIGYYPSWQWYDRAKLVNPETIDYSKYSIINYAFLYPEADGTITITDPWADKNLLLGTINWSASPAGYDSQYDLGNPAYHVPNTSIVYHAHQHNVPVLISLGGWTLSNDFPGIAADPVKRTNFAHWCNELIRVYDIDGIDIDWEYPGFADHNGTSSDKENFTLLLREVRDSLNAIESVVNKDLMLTAAFSADPVKMEDIEWAEITPLMDYFNLMSYDLFGAFSNETNHNAPLFAPAVGEPTFNCNSAVQTLINEYNVPSEKINMGVAFYGRSAKTSSPVGLHVGPITGPDNVAFAADEGTPLYYNILKAMESGDFTDNWDDVAKVPYLTNASTNSFVSYDNEESIRLKGEYIVDHNLGGAIIWEITGDYIETSPGSGIIGGTPLTDALNEGMCYTPSNTSISELGQLDLSVYPNPFDHQISMSMDGYSDFTVTIYDVNGKLMIQEKNKKTINSESLPTGIYMLKVTIEGESLTKKIIKL